MEEEEGRRKKVKKEEKKENRLLERSDINNCHYNNTKNTHSLSLRCTTHKVHPTHRTKSVFFVVVVVVVVVVVAHYYY